MLSKLASDWLSVVHSPLPARVRTSAPRRSTSTAEGRRVSPAQRHSRLISGSWPNAEVDGAGKPRSMA
jgi:hypothetical protein